MEPNENLEEQRKLAEEILTGGFSMEIAIRLAELVQAMDEWLTRDGFLPEWWKSSKR